jgi:hypothetical protein
MLPERVSVSVQSRGPWVRSWASPSCRAPRAGVVADGLRVPGAEEGEGAVQAGAAARPVIGGSLAA